MDGYLEEKNMSEINKGNLTSHIILWVVIICIGIYLIYSATHTNTEYNRLAPGASSNDNHSIRWPFTIDLNFACSRIGAQEKFNQQPTTNMLKK